MNRRKFLAGAAWAPRQLSALRPRVSGKVRRRRVHRRRASQAGGRGGGRGRGGPANVSAQKLARIAIMTLNHSSIIKLPWQEATPARTLDIFDLPKYYVDVDGVRNVEFQSNHIAENADNPDLAYIKELRARLDAAGSKANQINIEIGTMARWAPTARLRPSRATARGLVTRAKNGRARPGPCLTRLMHNQGALTDDSKAGVISLGRNCRTTRARRA